MQEKKLVVQKYGGATLSDPDKIKSIAKKISDLNKSGTQVVAVVSAMGKTTNQLIDLAYQVSAQPLQRELDMLLTTGERISMALLSLALNDLDCDAISFTGSQAGILTDDSHFNAQIIDVKAFRVEEALKNGRVVVLAGFQGVSPQTKEITTLGRGGTDTTAVAMAAYLKADRCEILKDVSGVFTADPHVIPNAKPIKKLSYDQLSEMTFWGAKVLHYRCVELAKRNEIEIHVGPATGDSPGTLVTKGEKMFESKEVIGLNSHVTVLKIEIKSNSPSVALEILQDEMENKNITFPQILNIQTHNDVISIYLTGPNEIISAIQRAFNASPKIVINETIFSSVSATCAGSTSAAVPEKILKSLDSANIPVQQLLMSPMTATAIVFQRDCEKALKELHKLIG